MLEISLPEVCPGCGEPGDWGGHGSYTRNPYVEVGKRIAVQVLRFQCSNCPKTISRPVVDLPKHRHYCLDAILPLLLMYLMQFRSYEHCVWYPLDPSTLWRWTNLACATAGSSLGTLQRRLVEAGAALMAQAVASKKCENAAKAKLPAMRRGLNNLRAIVELAGQFLPEGLIAGMIFPRHTGQRYPPQSLQYALF